MNANPLRKLLAPGRATLIPGAANALSARIAESAGFDAVLLTGAGFANAYLGAPDLGLTTMTEVAQQIAAMREATRLAIIADGDTGFGNALNVVRTMRLFERCGADAIQLEDQTFPKRCGHFDGKAVIPAAEMVQKIKAAVDARQQDTLVLARSDACATEGLDAAIERASRYLEAGADMLFIEAPVSETELARIPASLPAVHVCNMVFGGKTPLLPRERLAKMGYAGVIYANAALQAAMLAMEGVLTHLREVGHLGGAEQMLASFQRRQAHVDFDGWMKLQERYAQE